MADRAEDARRRLAFRGGGFVPQQRRGAAAIACVILVTAWEVAVRSRWLSPVFLPSPSSVLAALYNLVECGTLWIHLSQSLGRILVGWVVGTLAGLGVGFAMGIWSLARAIGLPMVSALFPIPKIALLPLFILWFGIGESSKVVTIALGVFFPTVIATYSAVDGVARNLIRMGQSFNLPWSAIVLKIVLPGAMPGILAGFRISASIALILLVSAEMIGAQYGIGAFILAAGNLMQTDQLLAGVVILSILGLLVATGLGYLERRLLRWR
jgi:ABC-type nitrate/sulfonate/bicarbonate transport system permease component